ncbi:MAG: FHA domain-containing protein [Deltaproteobacteria bacterium]|nr:MAG: FHA domain-containing protein [Deltaproteobacteria bacterium]
MQAGSIRVERVRQGAEMKILQDYIGACLKMSRQDFCSRNPDAVFIQLATTSRMFQSSYGTRLSRGRKEVPLASSVIREGQRLRVHALKQRRPGPAGTVRVGRSSENDLVVDDDTVSTRHAVLLRDVNSTVIMVRDLGSTNGTWINGERVVAGKATVLFDGDLVAFGDAVFLFFYPEGLFDVVRASFDVEG